MLIMLGTMSEPQSTHRLNIVILKPPSMIKPIKLLLIAFILTFLSAHKTFSQEVSISNVFTFGGNGSDGGLNIFNKNNDLTIYLGPRQLVKDGAISNPTLWWNNTSGKQATAVFLVNGTRTSFGRAQPIIRPVPLGRRKTGIDAVSNFQFYYCYCTANPDVKNVNYALPVSPNKTVTVEKGSKEFVQGDNNRLSRFFGTLFKLQKGDTIRAARGGLIEEVVLYAEKEFEQINRLKVRHADGTISDYFGFEAHSVTVKKGDEVFTGMPLARASGTEVPNSSDLLFTVSYLKLDVQKEFDDWTSIVFMDPTFKTRDYEGPLMDNKSYVGFINTDLIIQEMSGRVKREFRRNSGRNSNYD